MFDTVSISPADLFRQLDTEAAAEFLDISPATMERRRREGSGPRYLRYGRKCVKYRLKDLLDYQDRHLSQELSA